MSNFAKRVDKHCLKEARKAVNEQKAEILQSFRAQTNSGPVTVMKVNVVNGSVKLTVRNQDGDILDDIDPGSNPIGPGSTAVLTAGKKLQ